MNYVELARAARAKTGMTRNEFANMIRASPRTVRHWETGTKPPNPISAMILEEIRDGWLPTAERKRRGASA